MDFDYSTITRNHYKNSNVAETYHDAYASRLTWGTLRFHVVARREQRCVARLLDVVSASRILDMPCGTGKLARVFSKRQQDVIAADISPEMLEIARRTYGVERGLRVQFAIVDAEEVSSRFEGAGIDVVVCLRLMHRVPTSVRARILREISKTSRYAIVSYGVESAYHRLRRRVRRAVFGGGGGAAGQTDRLCQQTMSAIDAEVRESFRVVRTTSIAPLLSEEVIFLLESTTIGPRQAEGTR